MALTLTLKSGKVVFRSAKELPFAERKAAKLVPLDERVYCFFGKSGVVALDLEGQQLWQTNVGKESSNGRWGSGASLVLFKHVVIVNASEENQCIRALDKATGRD